MLVKWVNLTNKNSSWLFADQRYTVKVYCNSFASILKDYIFSFNSIIVRKATITDQYETSFLRIEHLMRNMAARCSNYFTITAIRRKIFGQSISEEKIPDIDKYIIIYNKPLIGFTFQDVPKFRYDFIFFHLISE